MNRVLSLLFLTSFVFSSAAIAADKVVVIPLGGSNNSNSIIGSWRIGDTATNDLSVVTFIDATYYIIAESGTAEANGGPGMELGTYVWNTSTGEFTATVLEETNGDWGFSELNNPTTYTVSLNGNTLSFIDPTDPFEIFRIVP